MRTDVRQDPLHRAAAAACEGETDTVGEPVARDRAGGVEPPAVAQSNPHPSPGTPEPRHAKLRS
jgi:hypothetical protein